MPCFDPPPQPSPVPAPPMTRFRHPRFWLSLVLVLGTLVGARWFQGRQPSLQSHALAFLLSATAALSAYLFAVILDPERF
ncbi:MAG: potassium-transporting ATPase subunit F [Cyanobacteriota bacterium]|nr:potassium-transporting ATPase subunit F [Cyanobacteriota bacterium]